MKYSLALPVAWIALRFLVLLNWFSGIAIFALLTATIVAPDWTFAALGIPSDSWMLPVMRGLQAIAALGLVGVVINDCILRRLLAMIETVRAGNAFIRDNAYRLHFIAWFLLALQLLSIVIAIIGRLISTPEHPVELDAGFSINGWLAVLLTFILARVFAEGTLMREDLEGTV